MHKCDRLNIQSCMHAFKLQRGPRSYREFFLLATSKMSSFLPKAFFSTTVGSFLQSLRIIVCPFGLLPVRNKNGKEMFNMSICFDKRCTSLNASHELCARAVWPRRIQTILCRVNIFLPRNKQEAPQVYMSHNYCHGTYVTKGTAFFTPGHSLLCFLRSFCSLQPWHFVAHSFRIGIFSLLSNHRFSTSSLMYNDLFYKMGRIHQLLWHTQKREHT